RGPVPPAREPQTPDPAGGGLGVRPSGDPACCDGTLPPPLLAGSRRGSRRPSPPLARGVGPGCPRTFRAFLELHPSRRPDPHPDPPLPRLPQLRQPPAGDPLHRGTGRVLCPGVDRGRALGHPPGCYPVTFTNADSMGTMHFPGFSFEAAKFLVHERQVDGIGVDTLSLDIGPSTDFAVHLEVLGANKWGLENLANLATVPPAGGTLIAAPPKVEGASGGPLRVLAVW